MHYKSRKNILIPGNLLIDISEFIPIIDSQQFQRLRYVKQLGNIFRIFPGAVHTRFEHSLGSLYWTGRILDNLKLDKHISRMIRLYALIHDIGHGPYSHEIEPLLNDDHNNILFNKIFSLRKAINLIGIDFDEFYSFISKPNPLLDIVRNRNIGADKLDYMLRDSLHIGFIGSPDPISIIQHTLVYDNQYLIDEKALEEIKRFQIFYSYLHKNGYLNKASLMIEKMFARAIQEILAMKPDIADSLWELKDNEIEALIADSGIKISELLLECLEKREIFLSSLVIRPYEYEYHERIANKPIYIYGSALEKVNKLFDHYQNMEKNRELEDKIADILNIPRGCLLVAFSPHLKRLLPRDINIFCPDKKEIISLEKADQLHYKKLNSDYFASLCIRIGSMPKYRSLIYKNAEKVLDILFYKI